MKAWRGLVDNRAGKLIRADLGLVGTIRNVEVTCGCNGWHPHFHCLVFIATMLTWWISNLGGRPTGNTSASRLGYGVPVMNTG